MTVRYHERQGHLYPDYVCQREHIDHAAPRCQQLPGHAIDAAVAELLAARLTPLQLEVALAVQQELADRQDEADALRAQQVARAQYEADLAGQRYRRVDPNNRLVGASLEAEWNAALGALQEAQAEYAAQRERERLLVNEEVRAQVMALTHDFPRVCQDPHTTDHDRKRLARLLIEDVTLTPE
ncbi:MAG: transposase [Chloroflexi bacterium]|nr:transposase [Chloroflexota bacterium]